MVWYVSFVAYTVVCKLAGDCIDQVAAFESEISFDLVYVWPVTVLVNFPLQSMFGQYLHLVYLQAFLTRLLGVQCLSEILVCVGWL